MGAWSFGPIDNDTAADWMGSTMSKSKLPKLVEKGLKSKTPNEVRAAAFLLEQIGYTYMYDIDVLEKHLELAVARLEGILGDEGWIEEWSNRAAIRRSLRKQIQSLKKRLKGEAAPGSKGLMDAIEEKSRR